MCDKKELSGLQSSRARNLYIAVLQCFLLLSCLVTGRSLSGSRSRCGVVDIPLAL